MPIEHAQTGVGECLTPVASGQTFFFYEGYDLNLRVVAVIGDQTFDIEKIQDDEHALSRIATNNKSKHTIFPLTGLLPIFCLGSCCW